MPDHRDCSPIRKLLTRIKRCQTVLEANEENIAYPAPGRRYGGPPKEVIHPHAVVLFGATGDLARRKLLPGLARLSESHLAPELRVVGTSLGLEEPSAPSSSVKKEPRMLDSSLTIPVTSAL